MKIRSASIGILLAAANALAQQPRQAPTYSDHSRLLVWREEMAIERPIHTPSQWAIRRRHILAGMQAVMGDLPDRAGLVPLDVKIEDQQELAGYTRIKLSFMSEKIGERVDRVPAYLLIPHRASNERLPAILALHQTTPRGKAEVVLDGGPPNLQYGRELADRGYVVLAPDYPSFGDYSFDFAASGYASGTMKGIFNHMRCVDFLASRPEVDTERIGVIGHSLGGHNALFTAVFDDRLKVVVSSCGWTPFHDYYGGKLAGWTSPRYMPRIRDRYELDPGKVPFDFYEVVAALAPRPFFSNSPLHDDNFSVEGVQKAAPLVKEVYELFGAGDQLRIESPDCGHDFPPRIREQAYQFIDAALKPAKRVEDYKSQLPRIAAKSPADSLKTFKVLAPFRIEQVAAEPLVASPVAIAFDEKGRLFAVEMRDYPESANEKLGRVRMLEDTDGDGRFDKSTIYVEGLSWPTSVVCWNGGIFITAAPDILYCKDHDGDGRADERKVVFTGFGRGNVQGLLNSLTWGLDNRIHGATSSSGGQVRRAGAAESQPVQLSGRDFAFDPRTLNLEATSGGGQHGLTFDDSGHKFVCSNSDHIQAVMFEDRHVARNPLLAAPAARVSIAADGGQAEVFRSSPVEPWRVLRTRLRVAGKVPGPIEGGGRPGGYFSGATGITIYRGDAWPADFSGLAVVGDVGSNLVHRKRLHADGVGWIAERIDSGTEFVTSSETWFRPVGFANAPDGALYIIDMYREVIEHPESLPPQIKMHLDLTSGRERGRIYRLVTDHFQQRPQPRLDQASTTKLVDMLSHSNGWHRDTAARLLYERQDKEAVEPLKRLITSPRQATENLGRMHALYALDGLGALDAKTVAAALDDANPPVREHAVRLSERFSAGHPELREKLRTLITDTAPRVRYQLAFSLGALRGPERPNELARLASSSGIDRWMTLAVLSSASACQAELFEALISSSAAGDPGLATDLLPLLSRQIGRGRSAEGVDAVLQSLSLHSDDRSLNWSVVRQLAEGLAQAGELPADRLKRSKFVIGRQLLEEQLKSVREIAADPGRTEGSRIEAIGALALGSYEESRDAFEQLLTHAQSPEIQLAAVGALAKFNSGEVPAILLRTWPDLSPRVQLAAEETLLSRRQWIPALLSAIEAGSLRAASLDQAHLQMMLKDPDPQVRARCAKIIALSVQPRRAEVLERYQGALQLRGDPIQGKEIFRKTCAACHKVEDIGQELGPSLSTVRNRGAEAILVNVLDPNREVNPQFVNYLVVTADGRTLSGMIVGESATSISLKRGEGAGDTILRADIESLQNTGLSLMPENLEQQIDQQGMADVIAYLISAP